MHNFSKTDPRHVEPVLTESVNVYGEISVYKFYCEPPPRGLWFRLTDGKVTRFGLGCGVMVRVHSWGPIESVQDIWSRECFIRPAGGVVA